MFFEGLPVDLIAEILAELDLESLVKMSYLSKRFYVVASDASLNPWRRPIMRSLLTRTYGETLKNLSVRTTVPRQNWIDILTVARPSFILYEATLPNLKASEWEECFKRRFLPSWEKWRRESTWKEAFLKLLHRVWHRSSTNCKADESWTKFIVLNRNGSANELESSSRGYNPLAMFNEMKLQNNLAYLETRVELVLELADVRILALGTVANLRSNFMVNPNARIFLNPPGITAARQGNTTSTYSSYKQALAPISAHGGYSVLPKTTRAYLHEYSSSLMTYRRLTHPQPAITHINYPFFTPGGSDLRWSGQEETLGDNLRWVGGLMIIAQLLAPTQEGDGITHGPQQYASFGWSDLWAIAPWMNEKISKRINGAGL